MKRKISTAFFCTAITIEQSFEILVQVLLVLNRGTMPEETLNVWEPKAEINAKTTNKI